MKVLVYSVHGFDKPFLKEIGENSEHQFFYTSKSLSAETVHYAEDCQAVALFSRDKADAETLQGLAAQGVKYLSLRSVGFEHVDLDVAKSLGMRVANVPEYSPYAIAEHGVALLLMLVRKLYESQLLLQMQDFRLDPLVGFDLHGKTIGVVGTGNIGFAFAKIMHGFGCNLLASDPVENPKAAAIGMTYTTLDNLLKNSDVVSLNCPLNEHTKYMLGAEQFAKMKKGSILINTARGAVINTSALIESLASGHLGGACLDVCEQEKGLFFEDYRHKIIENELYTKLRTFKNVVVTGHQAFLTKEALKGIADTTLANLDAWEKSGTAPNELF